MPGKPAEQIILMKTPHQQHQVAALFTLQFYPSATANRSLLHFHQQILQSLYKKLASDPMACYNTGPASFPLSATYAFISLHLGTLQSASLQCFEWYSRSFHMKTHLLQPPWLRARISHRTPWKNNFFKVKQTWRVQLQGSKHLDACTRHSM